jgi:hypothetical protein
MKYCIAVIDKGFVSYKGTYTIEFKETKFFEENEAEKKACGIKGSFIIPMDLWRSTLDKFFKYCK